MHDDLLIESLGDNSASLPLHALKRIVEYAGEQVVVPCRNLEVEQFYRLHLCKLEAKTEPRPDLSRYWGGEKFDQLYTNYNQVVWTVQWNGHELTVVHAAWENGCGGDHRDWVLAESEQIAEDFILEVSQKTHAPGNAILVFAGGRWNRSEALYEATRKASFDDLVLADDLKETIRTDFVTFLDSESRYNRLGIAWRRGALIIGPPGNGKTHCVRALVKELNVSSLYVQSLSHRHYTPEQMWGMVFDRARGLRPCVLVLEDLDALLNNENRSFFLNQLDGFEQNHGLIVLATTNHPERIDDAIINRPSRFDRKYHFHLPSLEQRIEYLRYWQDRLEKETGWAKAEVEPVAIECVEYSFAYLKELIISSVMHWMHADEERFADVVLGQAQVLKQQMKTEATDDLRRKSGRSLTRIRP